MFWLETHYVSLRRFWLKKMSKTKGIRQTIKDRRLEAELFRNCNEFLLENDTKNFTFSDIILSSGGHDLKLLFLPATTDIVEAEALLKRLEGVLIPRLRHYLSKRLSVRHLPKISFSLDKGALNALKVEDVLKKLEVTEG